MLVQPETNPAKPLLRALHGEALSPPPVWLMRQAGRYLPEYRELRARAGSFLDLCYAPEQAARVTLQPIERFAMDAAILFSDILVIPHALGRRLSFLEGEGPSLDALEDGGAVAGLDLDGMLARLAPVYETVERVAASLPGTAALIGFAGAPWTVATYMLEGGSSRDFPVARTWMASRGDDFGALIDVLVEATIRHLNAQIGAGAEAVQLFDSWAGALEGEAFERWSIEPIRRIVAGVRESYPEVPVIGFPRGAEASAAGYRRFAERTGVNAVGIDTAVPVAWAAAELQPVCAVQGNLDPELLLAGGGAMVEKTQQILSELAAGPHVFNLGHGVLPPTPPENVALLTETIRAWHGS